jgi:hypothetical protein
MGARYTLQYVMQKSSVCTPFEFYDGNIALKAKGNNENFTRAVKKQFLCQ